MSSSVQTVLVVDDEPLLCRMMARALAEEGYAVLTATGGLEALAIAGALAERLALLVTDLDMPGMSGTELANRLAYATPVLFISGGGDAVSIRSSSTFLAKPFTLSALIERVHRILGTPAARTTRSS